MERAPGMQIIATTLECKEVQGSSGATPRLPRSGSFKVFKGGVRFACIFSGGSAAKAVRWVQSDRVRGFRGANRVNRMGGGSVCLCMAVCAAEHADVMLSLTFKLRHLLPQKQKQLFMYGI